MYCYERFIEVAHYYNVTQYEIQKYPSYLAAALVNKKQYLVAGKPGNIASTIPVRYAMLNIARVKTGRC